MLKRIILIGFKKKNRAGCLWGSYLSSVTDCAEGAQCWYWLVFPDPLVFSRRVFYCPSGGRSMGRIAELGVG